MRVKKRCIVLSLLFALEIIVVLFWLNRQATLVFLVANMMVSIIYDVYDWDCFVKMLKDEYPLLYVQHKEDLSETRSFFWLTIFSLFRENPDERLRGELWSLVISSVSYILVQITLGVLRVTG